MKLTDRDRATIVASVARNLFRPGANYEGEHFVLADGLRSEWFPKIRGYDVRLLSRDEIESARKSVFYYAIELQPLRKSVRVVVTGYDTETKDFPHVQLHYSYWRARRGWRGKYLWGWGD